MSSHCHVPHVLPMYYVQENVPGERTVKERDLWQKSTKVTDFFSLSLTQQPLGVLCAPLGSPVPHSFAFYIIASSVHPL